jgi:hypothetical protein
MAYISTKYCLHCERETNHVNHDCTLCLERIRREEMAAWQAKAFDEKLLDLHKRMLAIENRKPIIY